MKLFFQGKVLKYVYYFICRFCGAPLNMSASGFCNDDCAKNYIEKVKHGNNEKANV